MTDLVSRLLEAITAQEEKARAAAPSPWTLHADSLLDDHWADIEAANGLPVIDTESGAIGPDLATAEFIADNDPSSVLRRCAGDRELVGMCRAAVNQFDRKAWENDERRAQIVGAYTMAFMALTHLAEGYGLSDHQEGDNG